MAQVNDTVTIVIPTKNEAYTLLEVIQKIQPYGYEILLIDGHSTDNTREIAEQENIRVVLDNGRGKGAALRQAIEEVNTDLIVFIDADGSHDPNDIPRLLAPLFAGKADLVMGSRMTGGSDELHGTIAESTRLIGSVIITLGINYRFGVHLTDYQNGFRAIRTKVARNLNLQEDITTIEQEMSTKCLRHGYTLAEVPTHEYRRKGGVSKIVTWKVAPRYVYSWIKYMWFD